MNSASVDELRLQVSRNLDPKRRSALGQFMTPLPIARFMANLFSEGEGPIRLLDAGAGIGSLTSAFVERHPGRQIQVDAWEIDAVLRSHLERTLGHYAGLGVEAVVHGDDFIEASSWSLSMGAGPRFTRAILNPPYKKIASTGHHRLLLRQAGIETVNLYSAFLALAILLMEPGGEVVAIVPRSFCNGAYYRPFRRLLLDRCAIRQIHVFGARDKAFGDDDVLQENIIIKLVREGVQGAVLISDCHDGSFVDYRERLVDFQRIVSSNDPEFFIHVPSLDTHDVPVSPLLECTLAEIGLEVCTGPVVDFRLREHCRAQPDLGTVPLIYAHHFLEGRFRFPVEHKKKPNAILDNETTRKWLLPSGCYVLTRRFSAKEERRRVMAYVVGPDELASPRVGFENHLNVFHSGRQGIDPEVASGLAVFLNSTLVDVCFRAFSGHTQVNATDLRQMRYPSRKRLSEFGRWCGRRQLTQSEIDCFIREVEYRG